MKNVECEIRLPEGESALDIFEGQILPKACPRLLEHLVLNQSLPLEGDKGV
jgi:hypothetical protein